MELYAKLIPVQYSTRQNGTGKSVKSICIHSDICFINFNEMK